MDPAKIVDDLLRWNRGGIAQKSEASEGFIYRCVIRDIGTGEVLEDYLADRMKKD